jgi:hypothetical protein
MKRIKLVGVDKNTSSLAPLIEQVLRQARSLWLPILLVHVEIPSILVQLLARPTILIDHGLLEMRIGGLHLLSCLLGECREGLKRLIF